MIGVPKRPADRNPRLLKLADGEACTVGLPGGACDPATTVWAHTNTLADQKGRSYKGHDSQGFFACHRCHSAIDQPTGTGGLSQARREAAVAQAQRVTTARLIQISESKTLKPWKIQAARWALQRRLPCK